MNKKMGIMFSAASVIFFVVAIVLFFNNSVGYGIISTMIGAMLLCYTGISLSKKDSEEDKKSE